MSKRVLSLVEEKFGDKVLATHSQHGDDTAIVDPAVWRDVARFLRDDPRIAMNMFTDLTAVDFLPVGGVGANNLRFEVVCHLRSLQHAHRIRIKAAIGELDEEAKNPEIDSLVPVWRGADWFERETFDMFGVVFRGHPDMRRILMYEEFVGHPLRKDYPANKIQPLVPFREGTTDKLPPFGPDEGMSFGRQTHDLGRITRGGEG